MKQRLFSSMLLPMTSHSLRMLQLNCLDHGSLHIQHFNSCLNITCHPTAKPIEAIDFQVQCFILASLS